MIFRVLDKKTKPRDISVMSPDNWSKIQSNLNNIEGRKAAERAARESAERDRERAQRAEEAEREEARIRTTQERMRRIAQVRPIVVSILEDVRQNHSVIRKARRSKVQTTSLTSVSGNEGETIQLQWGNELAHIVQQGTSIYVSDSKKHDYYWLEVHISGQDYIWVTRSRGSWHPISEVLHDQDPLLEDIAEALLNPGHAFRAQDEKEPPYSSAPPSSDW